MDEKRGSNQMDDTAFSWSNTQRPWISKSFVHDASDGEAFGQRSFCLSVSPDKQKRYLCVLCASVVDFLFGQA